jgi:uncharacterized protein YcbX
VRVAELWRYPVKSLRGERLERADVLPDGFRGDRLTRVLGADGSHLTGRTATGLLGLQAGIADTGEPVIEGDPWDSDPARERIEGVAGAGATLAPLGRHFDAVPILVVTDGAVAALGEDSRRLRPNVVIAGVNGLAERNWVQRRLRLGPVELLVRERCERCVMTTIDPDTLEIRPDVLRRINSEFEGEMGVYCEVALGGELKVGDPVQLL